MKFEFTHTIIPTTNGIKRTQDMQDNLTAEEKLVLEQYRKAQEVKRAKELESLQLALAKRCEQRDKEQAEALLQNEAARRFFKDFDKSKFELVERLDERTVTVKYEDETIFNTFKYPVKTLYIQCTVEGVFKVVTVKKHIVYSGSWSSHGSDKGYKMFYGYSSRAYTNAKKVCANILNEIKADQEQKEREANKRSAFENSMAELKAKYPQAEVKKDLIGKYYRTGYSYNDVIKVTFPNGFGMNVIVRADGKLDVYSMFTSAMEGITTEDKLEVLSKINWK